MASAKHRNRRRSTSLRREKERWPGKARRSRRDSDYVDSSRAEKNRHKGDRDASMAGWGFRAKDRGSGFWLLLRKAIFLPRYGVDIPNRGSWPVEMPFQSIGVADGAPARGTPSRRNGGCGRERRHVRGFCLPPGTRISRISPDPSRKTVVLVRTFRLPVGAPIPKNRDISADHGFARGFWPPPLCRPLPGRTHGSTPFGKASGRERVFDPDSFHFGVLDPLLPRRPDAGRGALAGRRVPGVAEITHRGPRPAVAIRAGSTT